MNTQTFGECLPPKNSVLQLNHRVEFFQCFYSKITLTNDHDIPSGLNTILDFPIYCSL